MNKKHHNENTNYFLRTLGCIGNSNILSNHIKILYDRLSHKGSNFTAENDTDYYSWLTLNVISISQELEHKYYRHNPNHSPKNNQLPYKNIIDYFKIHLDLENKNKLHYVYSTMELRHRIIHLGVPNLIINVKNKKFIQNVLDGDYKLAEKYFQKAMTLLWKIPDPIAELPGICQIGTYLENN